MSDFYFDTVKAVGLGADDEVLVVCGGPYDRNALVNGGVKNAIVTNLDYHGGEKDLSPYGWEYQDAEDIKRGDNSADWVVVNAGLHHCGSPHKALCEMLRVARKGVIVLESRDSLLMRLAVRMGLTPDVEMEPALLTNGQSGGYRNTKIPNYIYRWTEREFEKTVKSFQPHLRFDFSYRYGYRLPLQRMAMSRNVLKRMAVSGINLARVVMETVMPRQGNMFAMIARKDDTLQPWLLRKDGEIEVDLDFLRQAYDPSKYKR